MFYLFGKNLAFKNASSFDISEAMGHLLYVEHLITSCQLQNAWMARQSNGMSLDYIVAELDYASEEDLTAILSRHYQGYPGRPFTR